MSLSRRKFLKVLGGSLLLPGSALSQSRPAPPSRLRLSTRASDDTSGVLVLVNDAWPAEPGTGGVGASVYVGQHYARMRHVPDSRILHLNVPMSTLHYAPTNEIISYEDYDARIQQPIKTYLEQTGLKDEILYIVPTYGVPSMLDSLPDDSQHTWKVSLDSVLATMYSGSKSTWFYNPYRSYVATDSPLRFKDWRKTQPTIYLVSRLDGPSASVAAGLVNKAIAAETTLKKTDGIGYYDWFGGSNWPDSTMKNAADVAVSLGLPAMLNNQGESGYMLSGPSKYLFNGSSLNVLGEGPNKLTVSFRFSAVTAGSFRNTFGNYALTSGPYGSIRYRLYSADRHSYWELSYEPSLYADRGKATFSKLINGQSVASVSTPIAIYPVYGDPGNAEVSFNFSETAGTIYLNSAAIASLTDSSAFPLAVSEAELVYTNWRGSVTGLFIKDAGNHEIWNDSFTSDTTGNYQWITAPRQGPDAAWVWGWYSGIHDAYEPITGAIGSQLTSYTAGSLRSGGVPYVDSNWCVYFLNQGFTATWGATTEPYTTGYTLGDIVFGHFWRGYNFAESAYLGTPYLNWAMVMVGDPLYAPLAFRETGANPPTGFSC